MSRHISSRSASQSEPRGFTLIELLVVIAIMGAVIGVIMMNQAAYTESAGLTNLADELGARVSEAQAYGIAVRERDPGTADFSGAYGVSLSLLASGGNDFYLLFADLNANAAYDGSSSCPTGGGSECVERVDFFRGDYIDDICIIRSSGNDDCNTPRRIDVSFVRPNPEAQLTFFNSGGNSFSPANVVGARIVLKSPSGLSRTVSVYLSGQVSVQ